MPVDAGADAGDDKQLQHGHRLLLLHFAISVEINGHTIMTLHAWPMMVAFLRPAPSFHLSASAAAPALNFECHRPPVNFSLMLRA